MPTLDLSNYLTTAAAAERYGMTQHQVGHLLRTGKVRGIKLGPRAWMVEIASLDEYNETKESRGRPRKQTPESQ